jgi:hypothetical protein
VDGFKALFDGLATNLPIAMLALCLLAIAWLVRALIASYDAKAKALDDAHAAHLQTALQVAPLAAKLVTCVEVLERLSTRVTGGA